jgi:hypothetical protein
LISRTVEKIPIPAAPCHPDSGGRRDGSRGRLRIEPGGTDFGLSTKPNRSLSEREPMMSGKDRRIELKVNTAAKPAAS